MKKNNRDLWPIIESLKGKSPNERRNAMQVGDYLQMPFLNYKEWVSLEKFEDPAVIPKESELVNVRILEILEEEGKVLLYAAGFKKKVDASLMYNFGDVRYSDHYPEFFSTKNGNGAYFGDSNASSKIGKTIGLRPYMQGRE